MPTGRSHAAGKRLSRRSPTPKAATETPAASLVPWLMNGLFHDNTTLGIQQAHICDAEYRWSPGAGVCAGRKPCAGPEPRREPALRPGDLVLRWPLPMTRAELEREEPDSLLLTGF